MDNNLCGQTVSFKENLVCGWNIPFYNLGKLICAKTKKSLGETDIDEKGIM